MNKYITLLLIVPILLTAEHAYLNGKDPSLTKKEIHSLKLAKSWLKKGVKSMRGKDGSITFIFGATMPSIVTAPLRITDIRLQPGEVIREVQLGDTVRWQVSPTISGSAPKEVSHIVIKPTDVNLSTTLAIFTDRRTYNLNLKSTKTQYTPIVNFHYADEINEKWNLYKNYQKKQSKAKEFTVANGSRPQNIDRLDFKYSMRGSYSWKPIRIYNDGRKTYIQMPSSMKHREAPILMVLDGGKQKLVNYRLVNDRFVVDKLFSQAVLIKGVGSSQEKIIISKKGRHTNFFKLILGDS